MGHVVLVGGMAMIAFVSTKKGYQWRYRIVLIYAVLFLGALYFQVKKIDSYNFRKQQVLMLR